MVDHAILYLPFPPSVNSTHKTFNGKRLSEGYRKWRDAAGWEVKSQRVSAIPGEVEVRVQLVAPDKRKRDGDNLLKAVFDLLKNHRIIDDDNNGVVVKGSFEWLSQGHPCTVHVRSLSTEGGQA